MSVLNPGTAGTLGWLGVQEAECQQPWARRGTNLQQLQVSSFRRGAPRAEGSSVPRTLCSIFEQEIALVPSVNSTWVCRQGKLALKLLFFLQALRFLLVRGNYIMGQRGSSTHFIFNVSMSAV